MTKEKLSKKEIEQLCVKDGIILERNDPFSNTVFYLPNMEKIGIMIREFDFLVEGAARGKTINEISNIEIYLHKHDKDPNLQKEILATNYSKASIYIESKKDMIADKDSENWKYIFAKYFSYEEIYDYFHKTESASSFFRRSKIFEEGVNLNYNLKLMEYLQSQIELFLPFNQNKEIPYKIDSLEFIILIFYKLGLINTLKDQLKEDYYSNSSKLLTTILGRPPSTWKQINEILRDIDHNKNESIVTDAVLNDKMRDVLYHYKIDLR